LYIQLDIPALTDKDKIDAEFIYKYRLPYVALSFVQKARDVQDLLDFFKHLEVTEGKQSTPTWIESTDPYLIDLEESWRPHIVSKIETPHAVDAIDEIIGVSDAIMVARGDLGVEVSLAKVPGLQKMIIAKVYIHFLIIQANAAEKPVITATQMLETMIGNPSPTRAEVSDVANAVFDGTVIVILHSSPRML
jgi:pyruvate kinase